MFYMIKPARAWRGPGVVARFRAFCRLVEAGGVVLARVQARGHGCVLAVGACWAANGSSVLLGFGGGVGGRGRLRAH